MHGYLHKDLILRTGHWNIQKYGDILIILYSHRDKNNMNKLEII